MVTMVRNTKKRDSQEWQGSARLGRNGKERQRNCRPGNTRPRNKTVGRSRSDLVHFDHLWTANSLAIGVFS